MTQFLVDMVDSVIIEFTRVLAGRRLSRQLEQISPVGALIEPVSTVLGLSRWSPSQSYMKQPNFKVPKVPKLTMTYAY